VVVVVVVVVWRGVAGGGGSGVVTCIAKKCTLEACNWMRCVANKIFNLLVVSLEAHKHIPQKNTEPLCTFSVVHEDVYTRGNLVDWCTSCR